LRTIGEKGSGAGQFNEPSGVAFDGAGNIIVVECGTLYGARVQILRYSDGTHVRTIGSEGSGNGQFHKPCSVAVDGSGNILVHDCGNGRIQVLRLSDGAYVRSMCSKGSGPGQLSGDGSRAGNIAFDEQGNVVVADSGNHRVQVLRYSDGAHLRTIGSIGSDAGQFRRPIGFALDGAGNIIVAEHDNFRVQVLRYSDGSHVRTILEPGGIIRYLQYPYGVVIDRQGRIIVSCGGNTIQVLQ
jgi:DNA-binding beta-propeller fold protein YncE